MVLTEREAWASGLCGCPPAPVSFADVKPSSARDEVAIAGPDGRRAAKLLARAKAHGTDLLAELADRAVRRLLMMPDPLAQPVLFDDDELERLRESLAATIATADLLGRARVRSRARIADEKYSKFYSFAEDPDPFHAFDEPIPPQAPAEAVSYFRRLVPTLGSDPYRYGPLLERHAFTLAVATDQVVLDKVKQAIAARLEGRAPVGTATADVQDVLDAAGVSSKNPQYAEMVYRTNMMESYSQGAMAELQTPDMQEFFPWWRYEGVLDSRTGDDHRPKIGRYYPVSAPFAEVRGPRVWNCRCGLTGLSRPEVRDLISQGARVETSW